MELPEFERLKKMLNGLPQRERETALACWGEYLHDDPPMGGVRYAAWAYSAMLRRTLPKGSAAPDKKKPHEVVKELGRLAADARSLRSKLEQVSRECLDMIENAAIQAPPLVPSEWNKAQRFVQHSDLHAWFQMRRGHYCEDGSMEEDEPWFGQDGMRPLELESLAQALEWIAKGAEARKQAPNGPRAGFTGRLVSVEHLLHRIGVMVSFRKCHISHTLPIARKIHEWATLEVSDLAEVPGSEWGQRPFDNIKPLLKALHWDEPDEIRVSTPSPWMPPAIRNERLAGLKEEYQIP